VSSYDIVDGQSLNDVLEERIDVDRAAALALVKERSVGPTPPSR
jgi:hypothetical protein